MPDVEGASTGAIGLAPYGDLTEHSGPPEIIVIPDTYRKFLATDARSVLITLFPQHYNFIPNPAFRNDATGWEINAVPAADAYSWTFASGTDAENVTLLDSIINATSSAVDPDPSTVDAFQNDQLVYISGADVWLVIDNGAGVFLTVADAASVGLGITGDVFGYRIWDPATDTLFPDDAWVGQSVRLDGDASLRYREGAGKFVYVGPRVIANEPEFFDPGRGSAEWTFSIYARGSGRIKLSMDAYAAEDRQDVTSGPQYQDLTTVPDPFTEPAGDPAILGPEGDVWILIDPLPSEEPFYQSLDRPPNFARVEEEWQDVEDDGRWHRFTATTTARVREGLGRVSFSGVWWIDVQIEVENADGLLLSAAMLDPTEYPECQYFDGDMVEELELDDFIWEGDANNSVSKYYFDRMLRTQWLWERMGFVVPAGRPFQIFFGAYDRPYVPPKEALEVAG